MKAKTRPVRPGIRWIQGTIGLALALGIVFFGPLVRWNHVTDVCGFQLGGADGSDGTYWIEWVPFPNPHWTCFYRDAGSANTQQVEFPWWQ